MGLSTCDASSLDNLHQAEFERLAVGLASAGWALSDGLFPGHLIDTLREQSRLRWRSGAFHQAGVGRGTQLQVHAELRNDHIQWLDPAEPSPAERAYLDVIDHLRIHLNRDLYLGLFDFEAQFAVYPPQHFYGKHLDSFRGARGRVVSCVLYLNEEWSAESGGALRLYLDDPRGPPHEDILPLGGRFVIFLSERFSHEVLPANRERLSLTGWFRLRAG